MRTTTGILTVIAAFAFAACAHGNQRTQQSQPGTMGSTSGGTMSQETYGQAGQEPMYEEPYVQQGQGTTGSRAELGAGTQDQYAQEQHSQHGEFDEQQPYGEQQQYGQQDQYAQRQQGERDQYGQAQGMTSDRELREQIQRALSSNPELSQDAISVRVENNQVHLAGLVDSQNHIRIARDVATSIPGVRNVDTNELRVR